MNLGDTLQAIAAGDEFIFDANGHLAGIKNRRAYGLDLQSDFIGPYAWASLPAAGLVPNKRALVTDVGGAPGIHVVSDGTRWKPVNGQAVLKRMGAAVSGINNTETVVAQALLPAGILQAGDSIFMRLSANKTGTTDNLTVSLRVGTAGTTADTALTGLSALSVASTTNITAGVMLGVRVLSNTSAQKMGMNGSNFGSYSSGSTAAIAAATTGLPDLSANAVWLTFTVKSSGATDTVGVQELSIIHEAG